MASRIELDIQNMNNQTCTVSSMPPAQAFLGPKFRLDFAKLRAHPASAHENILLLQKLTKKDGRLKRVSVHVCVFLANGEPAPDDLGYDAWLFYDEEEKIFKTRPKGSKYYLAKETYANGTYPTDIFRRWKFHEKKRRHEQCP